MTIEENDWRLDFGKEPAFYRQFQWSLKVWSKTRPDWDHDHCEFCMAKISDLAGSDVQPEGWTDEEETYWVCKSCFDDFMEMYQWGLR